MVKTEKLKCGVTLVTEHMPAFNSTAFGVWVKTGAVNETREIAKGRLGGQKNPASHAPGHPQPVGHGLRGNFQLEEK